ncbi:MFS transporter [Alistipes sp. An116]|uniref:MFS transporter n=1 Tax=Alistipes sp. An116 TaxID=1965546 RepID=UPI000B36C1CE|nr:MFS transporter [Alistipes sp. An116]OUQ53309.1 MFS transporter [Alistipes sp. An116]
MGIKLRLVIMNFLQYAIWGAYLTSMGSYLVGVGLATHIGIFYAMQGIVSLFMPAVIGIVADRWIPAQRLLGFCHLLAALFMAAAGGYAMTSGNGVQFGLLFTLYALSVAFYMPTIALSNSVAYCVLEGAGLDTVKAFPPIRVWGTVGFICSMLLCDAAGFQTTCMQFLQCAVLGLVLGFYAMTLPACPVSRDGDRKSLVEALGLRAFTLFKQKRMALFFIFSMLLGISLQITNGFANPFITSFRDIPEYASTFGANHANALISLSQVSETLCILLIPFFLKRFGIKNVMLMAMLAWVLRFGLFGLGNPGGGVWMFILSMIVYGVAFDFFNISGSLFVNKETDVTIRSSAQGLFMIMTNGIGATIGTLGAQAVVNRLVYSQQSAAAQVAGWSQSWLVFAGYALVVAVVFALVFRYKHDPHAVEEVNR